MSALELRFDPLTPLAHVLTLVLFTLASSQARVMLTFCLQNGVILLSGEPPMKGSGIADFPGRWCRKSFTL